MAKKIEMRWVLFGIFALIVAAVLIFVNFVHPLESEREEFDNEYFTFFSLNDTDGNTFGGKELGESQVTLFNAWYTACGPCIKEMPDLQRIYEEYDRETLGIAGIVADYSNSGEGYQEEVTEVIKSCGVKYPILLGDDEFDEKIKYMTGDTYPFTWVVDRNGRIIDVVTGRLSYDEWKERITFWLSEASL